MMPNFPQPIVTSPFVLYQSTLLNAYAEQVIHGFTGKPISLGGPGFSAEEVKASRMALCEHTGMDSARLVMPRQTHTDLARLNDLPCENDADAVILTEPGIPAMVQVADCVPIILYEPQQHIGAVIHSGWRGTAQAITAKVAQRLINDHGASPAHLIAAIGPSIGSCCYEVSMEVADAVAQTIPHQPAERYSTLQANGKPRVDLKRVNQLQLQAMGIKRIEVIEACTHCLSQELWSYRRNENGRQVAFLQLQTI
jgi:YfiH family protein